MEFDFQILPEKNLIRVKCTGGFAMPELIEAMKNVYADPLFRPGMNMLGDYREAELLGEVEAMTDYVDYSAETDAARGKFKSAVLVSDEETTALVTMFDRLAKQRGIGMETRGFTSEEPALAWLEEG